MASQAIPGPGFILSYDAGEGWVPVSEVGDITGPAETTDTVDVTNQDSVDGFKEYLATTQDGGQVTYTSHYLPSDSGQAELLEIKHDRTVVSWRITVGSTGYYVHFDGMVTGLSFSWPVAGVAGMNVTIKVTGPVTASQDS